MEFEVFEVAVSVVADSHNPTLLHPAFLLHHQIVPAPWEPVAEQTISSLPFSSVSYRNGISFQVEPQKLQVRQQDFTGSASASLVPELVKKYIQTLPEVRYSSLGINFSLFAEVGEGNAWLIGQYLKNGPWISEADKPIGMGVRLRYAQPEFTINVFLDPGKRSGAAATERQGMIVRANYHKELRVGDAGRSSEEAVAALNLYPTCFGDFEPRALRLLGVSA